MRIKVQKTINASPDGIEVKTYQKGEVYDLPQSLVDVFIVQGWGLPVDTSGPKEDKMISPTRGRGRPRKNK